MRDVDKLDHSRETHMHIHIHTDGEGAGTMATIGGIWSFSLERRRQGKDKRGHHNYLQILEKLPNGRIRFVLFGAKRVIVRQVGGSCKEVYLGVSKRKRGFPGGASGKKPACQGRRHKRRGFHPGAGKARQPTPVFLPGEPPWTEEPGRPQSTGSHRVDMIEEI